VWQLKKASSQTNYAPVEHISIQRRAIDVRVQRTRGATDERDHVAADHELAVHFPPKLGTNMWMIYVNANTELKRRKMSGGLSQKE
jgi:hypothetical protein